MQHATEKLRTLRDLCLVPRSESQEQTALGHATNEMRREGTHRDAELGKLCGNGMIVDLPADAREVIGYIKEAGRTGLSLPGDIRDEAFCQKLVSEAVL